MATQIHAFGPNGELSPGAEAALEGLGGGGGGATALGDLTDVDTTGATAGQVLTFDGSEWSPDAPSAGGESVAISATPPASGWWLEAATTTTTTTEATTTTTTTEATTTTTTTESGGGSLSFVPQLTRTHDGSFATYTFPNLDFGAAEATRTMVVVVGTRATNSVQSVTVSGVTATLAAASHVSTEEGAWIYHAAVPTGGDATHTIEVDFDPDPLTTRIMIQVYRATGGTLVVADTAAGVGNSPSLTVTNPAGGHVLAASTNYATTAATCSWAGATHDATNVGDSIVYLSTARTTTAGDVTPTPTWTLTSGVAHSVAVAYTLA